MKKWTPELITGILSIDEQHKNLFLIVDNLYTAIINRDQEIDKILIKLLIYSKEHFDDEGMIFLKYYNGNLKKIIKEHIEEHNRFDKIVMEKVQEYLDGKDVKIELALFLNEWITNHVIEEDIKLFNIIKNS